MRIQRKNNNIIREILFIALLIVFDGCNAQQTDSTVRTKVSPDSTVIYTEDQYLIELQNEIELMRLLGESMTRDELEDFRDGYISIKFIIGLDSTVISTVLEKEVRVTLTRETKAMIEKKAKEYAKFFIHPRAIRFYKALHKPIKITYTYMGKSIKIIEKE